MADPADPDHDGSRTGHQLVGATLDRVVGSQRRIGQRRSERSVEVADVHEVANRRHQHVVGQPAVVSDTATVPA